MTLTDEQRLELQRRLIMEVRDYLEGNIVPPRGQVEMTKDARYKRSLVTRIANVLEDLGPPQQWFADEATEV